MAQSLLTIDMVTQKTLQRLRNKSVVLRNMNTQFDDSFGKEGAKIGASLRVRLPNRFLTSKGAALQVQEQNEQYTNVAITEWYQGALNFTGTEQALAIDEYTDRYIDPLVEQIAGTIDSDANTQLYKKVYQSVGTPGTTPSTSLVLLQAQQKLNEAAAIDSPRYGAFNPAANTSLIEGMKGLFNPADFVSQQFKKGLIGSVPALGYDEIGMTQAIATHTTGDFPLSPIIATTVTTQGATSLAISFTSGTKTIKEGDVFTISSVYAVNPITRQTTGSLQQFVVTEDVTITATTTATVKVQPAIYTSEQTLATVNRVPTANDTITFMGAASTSYPQNLVYHKDAFTFATAALPLPQGVQFASTKEYEGISMNIVKAFDINNYRTPCRVDIIGGFAALRPQMAVRVWG